MVDQIGRSQPTFGIWLGRSREHLQDRLFIRTLGRMALMPLPDALISPCREIRKLMRRFAAWGIAFDPTNAKRHYRIRMTDASRIILLRECWRRVRAWPGTRMEAARTDGNTERALESG